MCLAAPSRYCVCRYFGAGLQDCFNSSTDTRYIWKGFLLLGSTSLCPAVPSFPASHFPTPVVALRLARIQLSGRPELRYLPALLCLTMHFLQMLASRRLALHASESTAAVDCLDLNVSGFLLLATSTDHFNSTRLRHSLSHIQARVRYKFNPTFTSNSNECNW